MAAMCVNHPERSSAGTCGRCGRETCSLCRLDVDGRLFCSLFCFTEHALATKRKSLREQTEADPLSNFDFADSSTSADALTEPSVVMKEEQADLHDEDSESVIRSLKQDQTSLLGLGSLPDVLSQPPSNETPLTFVLPGTRRATIQETCVFHADTPAIIRCSRCGDPICTICVGDETQGGRCTPFCRRDDPAKLRTRKLIAV